MFSKKYLPFLILAVMCVAAWGAMSLVTPTDYAAAVKGVDLGAMGSCGTNISIGGACAYNSDCASGFCLNGNGICGSGTCQVFSSNAETEQGESSSGPPGSIADGGDDGGGEGDDEPGAGNPDGGSGGGWFGCFGTIPANSSPCPNDSGFFIWNVAASCSTPTGSWPKCQRTCNAGYMKSGNSCIPIPPPSGPPNAGSCTGTIPSNSILCPNDDSGLSQSVPWSVTAACSTPAGSSPKCQRTCASGYVVSGDTCTPVLGQSQGPDGGEGVYGWAWSSNIGWIRMNACKDEDPFDSYADEGSCDDPYYGVKINNGGTLGGPGTMEGYAWSSSVGWLKFGGLSAFPAGSGTFSGNAELVGANTFRGWFKALNGGMTPGWDGWVSLAGSNHPSGAAYINGNQGVTYNPATARIVGFAWGGEVLGWVDFSNVTYGKPTAAFNYHLAADPQTISMEADSESVGTGIVEIERILDGGSSEPVTLSIESITPSTEGVGAAITTNPTCDPTCASNMTITVPANTDDETFTIIVKGVAQPSGLSKTVSVQLIVGTGISAPNVTCVAQGQPPFLVNKPVTWQATVAEGEPPFSFTWTGTNIPVACSGSSCQSVNGSVSSFAKVYATTGKKVVNVSVTDSESNVSEAICKTENGDDLVVTVQPNIKEF